MSIPLLRAGAALAFAWTAAAGAAPEPRAAVAQLLRELEQATNARDAQVFIRRATEDVIMVSKNGETLVGRPALSDYLDRMIGASASLRDMRSRVRLGGEPLVLGESFVVAYGTSEDRYTFASGVDLDIVTLWSASLAREAGEWNVAAIHYSFNLFDNPLLAAARGAVYWSVAAGLIAGLGSGLSWRWIRRKLCTLGRRT